MEAPDREHRDLARLSLESSVVVEAGAGTGKTTLLTDRILFLVLAGEKPAKVEEVVALTFTEKAAGEIKVRLSERLGELAARLSKGVLTPEAAERADRTLGELKERFQTPEDAILGRARAALEDLDKAPIGTIHSFCSQILRLYPVEAGVDPAFRVDADERGMKELFASDWARWLDEELGERPPRKREWLEVLALASLDDLEALACELCSEKLDPELLGGPDRRAAEELRALAERTKEIRLSKTAPKGTSKIMEALEKAEKRLRAAAEAAGAAEPSLTAPEPGELNKSAWPKAWAEDEDGKNFYEAMCPVAAAVSPRGEAIVRRAAALLIPFALKFRAEFSRRGWVSNDGLLTLARDLLRDSARPREELKRRFKTLLIDEFQDTDPVQGELLLYLSEAPGARAKSWKEVVPAPGRVFIVGDPKQSIYRFRGADIFAYEGFIGRLTAAKALACDLTANFRSVPEVIGPVNAVFSAVMKHEAGVQPGYKGIAPAKKSVSEEPGVRVVAITEEKGGKAPESHRTEALWIAKRILEEKRAYKDYAVLMRASTVLPFLLDAFKAHAIPYAVEIERDFYEAGEIGDLINLLSAIDDPEDRTALAGLLRSPLAALSDDGLLSLSRAGALDYRKDPPPKVLPEPERVAAARLFERLRSLRARAGRVPLGELVTAALSETRLPELAARVYHGQQTTSNLLKLQRKAVEASEARGATLKGFIAEINDAAEETRGEGESPLADEHLDAVRVMTMHKSKGLEFPVVFAMSLSSPPKAGRKSSLRVDWKTGTTALRAGDAASAAAVLGETREKYMEARESVRVLYVAMTRARESLYLVGRQDTGSGSLATFLEEAGAWPTGGAVGSLPAIFVAAGKIPEPEAATAKSAAGGSAEAAAEKAWSGRAKLLAGADRPRARAATGYLHEAPKRPAAPDEPAASYAGAEVGQLCHLVLQGWDFAVQGDAAKACAKARALLERRAPGPRWEKAQSEAAAVLEKFLASNAARELAGAEILGRELPFAYGDGKTVLRGAIDLVYRLKGKLVVADFKSEKVAAGAAPKIRKKYEEQGRVYLDAVTRAWGQTPEFRVLFLRAPEL